MTFTSPTGHVYTTTLVALLFPPSARPPARFRPSTPTPPIRPWSGHAHRRQTREQDRQTRIRQNGANAPSSTPKTSDNAWPGSPPPRRRPTTVLIGRRRHPQSADSPFVPNNGRVGTPIAPCRREAIEVLTAPRDVDAETPPFSPGGTNAIGQTLGLLGDEWSLLIIRHALMGSTRYAQFLSRLAISNAVLTHRLRTLVANGLLVRRLHPTARARTEYLLTPRSKSLGSVMLAMWAWERDWVAQHPDPLPEIRHVSCGQNVTPILKCRACGASSRKATSRCCSVRAGNGIEAPRRLYAAPIGPYPELYRK